MELAVYTDDQCTNEVGRGEAPIKTIIYTDTGYVDIRLAQEQNAYITTRPLVPGEYILYTRAFQGDEFSECSEGTWYEVLPPEKNPPTVVRPPAPSQMTLVAPSSPAQSPNPTIQVDGVEITDSIGFFQDPNCMIAEFIAAKGTEPPDNSRGIRDNWVGIVDDSGSIQVTLGDLPVGRHNIYAKRERSEVNAEGEWIPVESECSQVSVPYEIVAPKPSTVSKMALLDPSEVTNTPTLRVGDDQDWNMIDGGALVGIYTDSACTQRVGYKEAEGQLVDITTEPLQPGSYTFYSQYTRDGQESDCSTVSVNYTVQ